MHSPSNTRQTHRASSVSFVPRPVGDPEVRALYADFIAEADGPLGIDLSAETAAGEGGVLEPSAGSVLMVRLDGVVGGL